MKSGIFIRVGTKNMDIVDTDVFAFKEWWDELDATAKLRTVRHLLMVLGSM